MELRDYNLIDNVPLADGYGLMTMTPLDGGELPRIEPGQFVQVQTGAKGVLLRRPISICCFDPKTRTLELLVRRAGAGTAALLDMLPGTPVSLVGPLGRPFSMAHEGSDVLLVGGGVGVAPLLCYGQVLACHGAKVHFLLGARTHEGLLLLPRFRQTGEVEVTTEDGSEGLRGMVTAHPWMSRRWDRVACCGPAPMMKAVARQARATDSPCEVSLENMMACGVGACLCCVEKTVRGNVCVCREGPVFPTTDLLW